MLAKVRIMLVTKLKPILRLFFSRKACFSIVTSPASPSRSTLSDKNILLQISTVIFILPSNTDKAYVKESSKDFRTNVQKCHYDPCGSPAAGQTDDKIIQTVVDGSGHDRLIRSSDLL